MRGRVERGIWVGVAVLAAVFTAAVGAVYWVQNQVVAPHFIEAEEDEALRDYRRSVYGLTQEAESLDRLCHDWASWDDTYRYVRDRNAPYVASNLVPESLLNNRLCLLWIADDTGTPVWGRWDSGGGDLGPPPPGVFSARGEVFRAAVGGRPVAGVYRTGEQVLLLAARPILAGDGRGPPRGVLVMARRVDSGLLGDLARALELGFRVYPAAAEPAASGPRVGRVGDRVVVTGRLPTVNAAGGVVAEVALPPRISRLGAHAVHHSMVWLAAGAVTGFLGSVALLLMWRRARTLGAEKLDLEALLAERETMRRQVEQSHRELQALSLRLLSAQEEERRRISRELHDAVGQALIAVKYRVEALAAGGTEGLGPRAEAASAAVQGAVGEVRRICAGLRPPTLDQLGLVASLEWLCQQSRVYAPDVEIRTRFGVAEEAIPEAAKLAMFRLVQEGLANVQHHAAAARVAVELTAADGFVVLELADDGRGFPPAAPGAPDDGRPHLGLRGLRERVSLSGGTLDIRSGPGEGTTLRGRWRGGDG